ncbi:TPA: J domain-containing protein [Klebsiella pneumoniae]
MRTHYDNLKVSKDAPVEVIQAAYRTLAKKYHPDINKNNPEAVRIMQIINASYEVLIDPLKRT